MRAFFIGLIFGALTVFFGLHIYEEANASYPHAFRSPVFEILTKDEEESKSQRCFNETLQIMSLEERLEQQIIQRTADQVKFDEESQRFKENQLASQRKYQALLELNQKIEAQSVASNETIEKAQSQLHKCVDKLSDFIFQKNTDINTIAEFKKNYEDLLILKSANEKKIEEQKVNYENQIQEIRNEFDKKIQELGDEYQKKLAVQKEGCNQPSSTPTAVSRPQTVEPSDSPKKSNKISIHQLSIFTSDRRSPKDENFILVGEWEEPIWAYSIQKMLQRAGEQNQGGVEINPEGQLKVTDQILQLETLPFSDQGTQKLQKTEGIIGQTFEINNFSLQKGIMKVRFEFEDENHIYSSSSPSFFISCSTPQKKCEVIRPLSTWKTQTLKVFDFRQTFESEYSIFDLQLKVRKIACDIYIYLGRAGKDSLVSSFLLSDSEFCSNDFKIKFSSELPVTVELSPFRVSNYHGSCSIPTVCQCFQFWASENCNVPDPEENRTRYDDSYERLASRYISQYQSPAECSTNSTRVLVFSFGKQELSFGRTFDWLLAAFSYSLKEKRTFILAPTDSWYLTEAGQCQERSWSCYFESVSKCDYNSLVGEEKNLLLSTSSDQRVVYTYIPGFEDEYFKTTPINKPGQINDLPREFKEKGILWWKAQLLTFLWKYNAKTQQEVNSYFDSLQISNNFLGIHLTREDFPVEWYSETIERFSELYRPHLPPIHSVYLATTNFELIEEFMKNGKYKWYYPSSDMRHLLASSSSFSSNSFLSSTNPTPQLNRTEVALTTLKITETLIRSTNFITSFSSDYANLILQLKLSRRVTSFSPFASIDLSAWDSVPDSIQWAS